jgi:dTDP-4-dehydrorhamnose reductase
MLGSMLAQVFASNNPTLWDREDIDITDAATTSEMIRQLMPEVIINAAAFTDVDGAETKRDAAFAVNEHGVHNLAVAAKAVNAALVHYSTDYVFPGTQAEGYGEDDATGPAVNVYGQSKLAGEKALLAVAPTFYLLRTAWLYGPNGKNFVDTMLQLAHKGKPVKVVNDQFGSPTFTKDVANVTREILKGDFAPGIYHTVNQGRASWFDFAQQIFTAAGAKVDVQPVASTEFPRPAKRPKYSMLKDTKGLGLRPWQEALNEYITSYFHT